MMVISYKFWLRSWAANKYSFVALREDQSIDSYLFDRFGTHDYGYKVVSR